MTAIEVARAALAHNVRPGHLYEALSVTLHALRSLIAEHERVTTEWMSPEAQEGQIPWEFFAKHAGWAPPTAPTEDCEHDWHNRISGSLCSKCNIWQDKRVQETTPPTDDEREAQRGTSEDPQDSLARLIWETSRDDEGTISATGANFVARAVLAAGFRRQGPITDEWEYGYELIESDTRIVLTQGFPYDTPEGAMARGVVRAEEESDIEETPIHAHAIRRRKAGPWEPVEAARAS